MELLRASDIMATELLTLSPSIDIYEAIGALLQKKFSGAPVVDEQGALVGILSEKDCMRVLANEVVYELPGGCVGDYMTTEVMTVEKTIDVIALASIFLKKPYRRLPVVDEKGSLIGQVSRRDVLRGIERMRKPTSTPYPDYRRPS